MIKASIIFLSLVIVGGAPTLAWGSQCGAPVATDPSFQEVLWNIVPGAPSVPRYPGSLLVGSSIQNPPGIPDTGYKIKWVTSDSVRQVILWSRKNLPRHGWEVDPENISLNAGEITDGIRKGNLDGYFEATGQLSPERCTEITFSVQYK